MKSILRSQARLTRKTQSVTATAKTANRLAEHFIAGPLAIWPDNKPVIAGYWPFGSEIDTRPLLTLLADQGHQVVLPVSGVVGEPLSFRRWQSGMELLCDAMGMAAPPPGSARLVPDIVIVPALAFDKTGHRLGYGKGYYDVTLRHLRATGLITAVTVAYAGQEVDTIYPGPHDQAVDWIVTEDYAKLIKRRLMMDEQEYKTWKQENDLRPLYAMALELKCFTPTQLAEKANVNRGGLVSWCVNNLVDGGIATRNRSHVRLTEEGKIKLRDELDRLNEAAGFEPLPL